MSNIYRHAKNIAHFQMPQALIPKLPYISFEEIKLLTFLNSEAQRTSKSDVSLPGVEVSRATGIHPTNLGRVRKNLMAEGLLLVRNHGRSVIYSVCDPADRTPVPDGTPDGTRIDFDMLSADVLRRYFEPLLARCKPSENGFTACCPFPDHDDQNPSFTVRLEDGSGGVWRCHGCDRSGKLVDFEVYRSKTPIDRQTARRQVVDRLHSLGVTDGTTGQEDVVFSYFDADGVVDSETVRPNGDKGRMYRRRPNPDKPGEYISNEKGCRNLLYRLPEVMAALTVVVTEGEPDADAVRKLKLTDTVGFDVAGTTCAKGAGAWRREHSVQLKGKRVILLGDTDAKGQKHMQSVQASVSPVARALVRVDLPSEFRDVSHYLETHSREDLVRLVGDDWLQPICEI